MENVLVTQYIKKIYLPTIGVALIFLSVNHYKNQPFYNNGSPEVDFDYIYNTGLGLDCESIIAEVNLDFDKGTIDGKMTYNNLSNLSGKGVNKVKLIINSGYTVKSIIFDGEPVEFTDLADDNFIAKHIEILLPSGRNKEFVIEYGGYPKLWGAYKTSMGQAEISRNNVELRNYAFIPSLRLFGTNVKAYVSLPDNLTLLAVLGKVNDVTDNGDGTKTWLLSNSYDYIDIYASDYACRVITSGKTTVEFYHHKNFTELLELYDIDSALMDVFDFCTSHFGPLHYLQNNKLQLVQTSAFNFGGGAGAGMSNMGETTFSTYSLTDPWKGASGMEILAHEIIHQWWGLNRMIWEDPKAPEWTSEGLTVYSTYRLYKEKYGEDYAQKNYVDKWRQTVDELNRSFYRRHPEYLDIMPEDFAAKIRVKEIEVSKYSLMPLKIYKAAELVGGEEVMDDILKKLASVRSGSQLTYEEFLNACGLTKEAIELE